MPAEWTTRREEKVTYQVELAEALVVVTAQGAARRALTVHVTYRRRDGGEWKRVVNLFTGTGWNTEIVTVPAGLRSVPAWLEDIMTMAEGMDRG